MRTRPAQRWLVPLTTATALVLAGCGTGGDSRASAGTGQDDTQSADGGSLTIWFPGNNPDEIELVTEELVPRFESMHEADVEVTFVPWEDVSTRLNTGFAGDTAPDVFGHGPAAAAGLAEADRLEPLDDFVETMDPADLDDLASFLLGGQVGGTQYMVPLGGEGRLIAYRKDLFAEAGLDPDDPPASWTDAYDAAVELTDDGTVGLILQTGSIQRVQSFMGLLGSEGGHLVSDGTEVAWKSDAGVRALEYFVRLHQGDPPVSDLLGADFANQPAAQNPLATGAAAMVMVTSGQAVQIARARPELAEQIALIQPMSGDADAAMFGGPGPGLFLSKDSENKELAWAFMEFMLSAEVAESYAEVTGQIPVRASAIDGSYVASEPLIASFIEAGSQFVGSPNVPAWVEVRNILDKHLERALHGEVSPRQALDDAAAEAGPLLAGE